jgi:hypothetical protein
MKRILFETDWLASQPVFYNEKTGKGSQNINHVIDYSNLELHPEGFNNYLDFGYSVLDQTPVKYVRFLRHSSRLWADEQGVLSVEYLNDPVEQWLDYRLSEDDVIDLIRERVQKWEHSVEGEIIIPTRPVAAMIRGSSTGALRINRGFDPSPMGYPRIGPSLLK